MSEDQSLSLPKPTPADAAHLAAKAVLSAIPTVGGPVAELFAAIVHPPLERRMEQWREDVAAAIRRLQESNSVDMDALLNNEHFSTMVVQATAVVLRNHHQEKREALKNAIVNSVLSRQVGSDLHLAFVRFVDELSPAHVKLLKVITDREREIAPLKSYTDIYRLISGDALGDSNPDLFKMLCLELESRGLIRISPDIEDFPGIYEESSFLLEETRDDLPRLFVSEIGHQFLAFISDPTKRAA